MSPHALTSGRAEPPHAGKFRLAHAFLAGIGLAALVIAVLLVAQGSTSTAPAQRWSAWTPAESGDAGVSEIAAHVGPQYLSTPGDQLDVVTVVPTASPDAVAASASGTAANPASGLEVAVRLRNTSRVSLLPGTTVAFGLCGIGRSDCAIGTGIPSAARLLLLRREALELALYTLHYEPGVDSVVVLLPPGHSQQVTASILTPQPPRPNAKPQIKPLNTALLFLRAAMAPLLAQPLGAILPEALPPSVELMTRAPEANLVAQVTRPLLFNRQLETAQDGSRLLMLDQMPQS